MKRLRYFTLLLFLALSAQGQISRSKELIVGRWDLTEKIKDSTIKFEPLIEIITKDPDMMVKNAVPRDTAVVFFFTSENEFQELFHGSNYRFNYHFLTEDVLILGETTYKVLDLTDETLKIQAYPDELMSLGEPDILIFQKSSEPFKLIKEFENHLLYYANGQRKEEGQYHNGQEHGIWRTWFENGQQESQKVFMDGIPIGIWKTWDNTGKLLEEKNYSND